MTDSDPCGCCQALRRLLQQIVPAPEGYVPRLRVRRSDFITALAASHWPDKPPRWDSSMSYDAELVKKLVNVEAGLSAWEMDFLESIADRVESGIRLTEGQRKKAEETLARFEDSRE